MKSAVLTTSYNRTHEVKYNEADFIEWVKNTELPYDDAYFLLIEYLSEEYQGLFYLDGEIIEDIDFEISKELEDEIELTLAIFKYDL